MRQRYVTVQRRHRRAESGFTLIELLIVIAILGVLAGIVIFNVSGVTNRGNTAACDTDRSTVQAAVDAYRSDHGGANGQPGSPPSMGQLVPAYIHTTPNACATYSIAGDGTVTTTYK